MPLRLYIIILTLLLSGLAPGLTYARPGGPVSGVVLYGTGGYRAEVDGTEVQTGKWMYQQYSLRYQKEGLIGDARVGRYSLVLGYEFNVLDSRISYQGSSDPAGDHVETGKLFYQGSFVVAPGGLPFRLTVNARDLKQTLFAESQLMGSLPVGQQPFNKSSIVGSEVVKDFSNGTHRQLSATLLVGIRNGSYLGAYRDVLSQLPRLLVDFRQVDIRDTSNALSKTHLRSRDLAFVSLNKKDNWVHYRMHDFTDFLDNKNNAAQSQVMIGMIDHTETRQWINLTNWIKLSADLSYSANREAILPDVEKIYHANLFAIARREKTQMTVLSSLERTTQGRLQTQDVDVPVYLSYEASRDSFYRGRLTSNYYRQSFLADAETESSTTQSSGSTNNVDWSAELFRTHAVVFKPQVQLESSKRDDTQMLAEKLGLEWSNRPKTRESLRWMALFSLSASQSTGGATDSDYVEKSLAASAEKSLSRNLRSGIHVTARSGNGTSGTSTLATGLDYEASSYNLNEDDISSFEQYNLGAFLDHVGDRYANRLDINIDATRSTAGDISTMTVTHMLEKRSKDSDFTLDTSLIFGDIGSTGSYISDYLTSTSTISDKTDFNWSSTGRYTYTPDRRIRFVLTGDVLGSEGGDNRTLSWTCSEKLDYRFFTINGIVRKLAEISEEIGWEKVSESVVARDRVTFLRLSGSIYPTKYFYTKVNSEFISFGPGEAMQVKLAGETGLNFEKMQVALSYARGYKEQENELAELREERWDVKVKKTF